MATVTKTPTDRHFVLHNVSWKAFQELSSGRGVGARLTYDRGDLELMSPSREHEAFKRLIGRMIEMITLELNIPIASCGSMTCKRELLEQGVEPDECFYILNEPAVRGGREIDLDVDPPPDLAVEVEITRNILDRLSIYASLGVPEIWSYEGSKLHVRRLAKNGTYSDASESQNLPMAPIEELERFLKDHARYDETTLMRSFRDWVRANLAGG